MDTEQKTCEYQDVYEVIESLNSAMADSSNSNDDGSSLDEISKFFLSLIA